MYWTTKDATFFGSDITVFAEYINKAIFLEDNEYAILDGKDIKLFNLEGEPQKIKIKQVNWTAGASDKKLPPLHAKEIHEQPAVLSQSIQRFVKIKNLTSMNSV